MISSGILALIVLVDDDVPYRCPEHIVREHPAETDEFPSVPGRHHQVRVLEHLSGLFFGASNRPGGLVEQTNQVGRIQVLLIRIGDHALES